MNRLSALLLACALAASACTDSSPASTGEGTESTEEEPQTVYVCPMHCVPEGQTEEYTSNEPGACPVCGMDLVEKE